MDVLDNVNKVMVWICHHMNKQQYLENSNGFCNRIISSVMKISVLG